MVNSVGTTTDTDRSKAVQSCGPRPGSSRLIHQRGLGFSQKWHPGQANGPDTLATPALFAKFITLRAGPARHPGQGREIYGEARSITAAADVAI